VIRGELSFLIKSTPEIIQMLHSSWKCENTIEYNKKCSTFGRFEKEFIFCVL
jgi:hypothetical protein